MRTDTLSPLFGTAEIASPSTPRRKGLGRRMFDAMIDARLRSVQAEVNRHLAAHSDQDLKALGWSEADIARLRRAAPQA